MEFSSLFVLCTLKIIASGFVVEDEAGSDNFRQSAILDVMEQLKAAGVEMLIYEPAFAQDSIYGCPVLRDLEAFKTRCGLIIANRYDSELDDVEEKVYTRDLYSRD